MAKDIRSLSRYNERTGQTEIFYPATTTDAIAHPTKQKSLTDVIGDIEMNSGAYDISAAHSSATYADLAAALGTNGANVPESYRRGGMTVKYVQTSDNKYVQYRLMADEWSTSEEDWQGVDKEPTAASKNLVESGGTYLLNQRINTNLIKIDKLDYPSKEYLFRSNYTTLVPCALEAGEYTIKNNSSTILFGTLVDAEENEILVIDSNGIASGATKAFTLPSDCLFMRIWHPNSAGTYVSKAFTISAANNLEKRVSKNTEDITTNKIDTDKRVLQNTERINTNKITIDKLDYPSASYLFRSNNTTLVPLALEAGEYIFKNNSAIGLGVTLVDAEENVICVIDANGVPSGSSKSFELPSDCVYAKIWRPNSAGTSISLAFTISIDNNLEKRVSQNTENIAENTNNIGELKPLEKSFDMENSIAGEETLITSIASLALSGSGYSQAIDVEGYARCKLAFSTATYTGYGLCQLGYQEYDSEGNVLQSVLPDTNGNGGLYFIKADGTTTNFVNTNEFPNGGYCYIDLHENASYIKIRAMVNSGGTVISDRVPTGWSFYGNPTMHPLKKEAIIGSGITVDDLLGNDDVTFEQGGIVFDTGIAVGSSDSYIRTGYLNVDDYQYVRCEKTYPLRVFYYDASKNFISSDISKFNNQILVIKYPGAKYFRITINHTGITPSSSFYFYLTKRLTKDAFEDIYADGIARLGTLFDTDGVFKFIDNTDLHSTLKALDVSHDIQKLFGEDIKMICTGDVVYGTPRINNVDDVALTKFCQKLQEYGVYFCVGQHEVGFQNLNAGYNGKLKSNCLTHQEVFEYFIEPMKSFYGLPNDYDKIWYKVDFGSTAKTILISLYQWNVPLVDDPNDNTKYKYIRSSEWYGQDQINWFISTLNSVPENYHVIVLIHEVESNIIKYDDNPFFGPKAGGVNRLTDGKPIMEILDAYISRTTINQTYTATHGPDPSHDDTDYTDLSLTAVGDFTNAKGSFAFYISGDCHADSFGKLKDAVNTQIVFCLGSPTPSTSADKKLIGVGKDTFVTGFNIKSGYHEIKIGRLGNTESAFMQDRSRAVMTL